nr:MAG TPA: hypothetical protein [Caudoviricetes sp.]DAS45446.1 MAG TPA: hypothetical protein [Caudoviricetes sp.]
MANNNRHGNTPLLDSDMIRQFVDNQAQELAIRRQTLEINKMEINNSHQYALKNLDALKEDRKDQREHERRMQSKTILLVSIIIGIFALFGGYCLWIDKEKVLEEFFKFLIYAVPSAGGGYFYGYSKAKKKGAEDYTQED